MNVFFLLLFRILFLFYKSFCVSWSKYINEEEDKIWFNDEVNRGFEIGIDFSRVFFKYRLRDGQTVRISKTTRTLFRGVKWNKTIAKLIASRHCREFCNCYLCWFT